MPSKRSECESEVWACFAIDSSLFWGGEPGEQLVSVPAALRELGDRWKLVEVALVGASDVAELHYLDDNSALFLTFDYQEGSETEGTWGYRWRDTKRVRTESGYRTPVEAMQRFRSRWLEAG